jgi:hypothetical protein
MLGAMRSILLALVGLLAAAPAGAERRAAPPRLHFIVKVIDAVASAPAELSVKTRTMLGAILAARPDFVVSLDGAPDPEVDPQAFRKYAVARHVTPYAVTLKISEYQRSLTPNTEPGKAGQVLTIKLSLQVVGTKFPGETLALAGSGGATVMAEVGARLRPREEEGAMDDALRSALTKAVDEAVAELTRGSRTRVPKKKR